MLKIVHVMRDLRYLSIAVLCSLVFAAVYIYTQLLGIVQNFDLWIAAIEPLNLILFILFVSLFGIAMSFQLYLWKQPKACKVNKKSVGTSGTATVIGLLVAQCPACASAGTLLLPAGAAAFFAQYNILLNILSLGLMLFTINYLGGFRRV